MSLYKALSSLSSLSNLEYWAQKANTKTLSSCSRLWEQLAKRAHQMGGIILNIIWFTGQLPSWVQRYPVGGNITFTNSPDAGSFVCPDVRPNDHDWVSSIALTTELKSRRLVGIAMNCSRGPGFFVYTSKIPFQDQPWSLALNATRPSLLCKGITTMVAVSAELNHFESPGMTYIISRQRMTGRLGWRGSYRIEGQTACASVSTVSVFDIEMSLLNLSWSDVA